MRAYAWLTIDRPDFKLEVRDGKALLWAEDYVRLASGCRELIEALTSIADQARAREAAERVEADENPETRYVDTETKG